jgi:hypothetical protein
MSCGETCSTHGCNQSAGCAAHTTPVEIRSDFRLSDLAVSVVTVLALGMAAANVPALIELIARSMT